jgi:hypothetical protein
MGEWSRVLLEVMQICFHVEPKFAKICDTTVVTLARFCQKIMKLEQVLA